ncbi:hypothetical protein MUK42_27653 [Musa troglodytarum]|uniref:Uncharacterized protein n=1 Tax=Musa troglodytarum TaxID=320322 RepID=A0A9E7FUY0_9LILI|nr:hypothetical protein MUK42_27653 [Musa troglodytarum]
MEGRRGTQDVGFVGRGGRRWLDLYGGSWNGCGRSMPCASRLRFDWMQERDCSGGEPSGVDFDHPAFSRDPVHLSDLTKINSRRSSRKGAVREASRASFVNGGRTPRRLTDARAPFADRLFFDGVGFLDQGGVMASLDYDVDDSHDATINQHLKLNASGGPDPKQENKRFHYGSATTRRVSAT